MMLNKLRLCAPLHRPQVGRFHAPVAFVIAVVFTSMMSKLAYHSNLFHASPRNGTGGGETAVHKEPRRWFMPNIRLQAAPCTRLRGYEQYDLATILNIKAFSATPQNLIRNNSIVRIATSPADFPVNESLAASVRCTWPESVYARYYRALTSSSSSSSKSSLTVRRCPTETNILNRPSVSHFRAVLQDYHGTASASASIEEQEKEHGQRQRLGHDLQRLMSVIDRNDTFVVQIDPVDNEDLLSAAARNFILAFCHHVKTAAMTAIIPLGASPIPGDVQVDPSVLSMLHTQMLSTAKDPNQRIMMLPPARSPMQYDAYLAAFAGVKTLLVHKGPGAVLATMAAANAVTWDTGMLTEYTKDHEFRWQVANDLRLTRYLRPPTTRIAARKPTYHEQWRTLAKLDRLEETCCAMEQFAEGDGEKYLCTNAISVPSSSSSSSSVSDSLENGGTMKVSEKNLGEKGREKNDDSCWLLSIGCGGLFDFERLMIDKFPGCKVHLFDCTGDWIVPSDIAHAVTLHKLCVGNATATHWHLRHLYRPLAQLIALGGGNEGAEGETKMIMKPPALFKFDAEGAEFSVLSEMVEQTPREMLPKQMVIEFHLRMWGSVTMFERVKGRFEIPYAKASEVLEKLKRYGYRTVYRADNPGDEACTELTMVLEQYLPARRISAPVER